MSQTINKSLTWQQQSARLLSFLRFEPYLGDITIHTAHLKLPIMTAKNTSRLTPTRTGSRNKLALKTIAAWPTTVSLSSPLKARSLEWKAARKKLMKVKLISLTRVTVRKINLLRRGLDKRPVYWASTECGEPRERPIKLPLYFH